MRSHGTGRACRDAAARPPSGSCAPCRAAHTKVALASNARYKTTAKGMLADVRSHSKERGSR